MSASKQIPSQLSSPSTPSPSPSPEHHYPHLPYNIYDAYSSPSPSLTSPSHPYFPVIVASSLSLISLSSFLLYKNLFPSPPSLPSSSSSSSSPRSSPPSKSPVLIESATLSGLSNVGNTCYMGALLQSLSASVEFNSYCNEMRKMIQGIIKTNSRQHPKYHGMNLSPVPPVSSPFSTMLSTFLSIGHSSSSPFDSRILYDFICQISPKFRGYNQHDAHELFVEFIDMIKENYREIEKKGRSMEREKDKDREEKKESNPNIDNNNENGNGNSDNVDSISYINNFDYPIDIASPQSFTPNVLHTSSSSPLLPSSSSPLLSSPFDLIISSTLQCTVCHSPSFVSFSSFSNISLSPPSSSSTPWSLASSITQYFAKERIDGVKCNNCTFIAILQEINRQIDKITPNGNVQRLNIKNTEELRRLLTLKHLLMKKSIRDPVAKPIQSDILIDMGNSKEMRDGDGEIKENYNNFQSTSSPLPVVDFSPLIGSHTISLSLPLPSSSPSSTLPLSLTTDSLLSLSSDLSYLISSQLVRRPFTKSLRLTKYPKIFCFHLNRLMGDYKVQLHWRFPLAFNMEEIMGNSRNIPSASSTPHLYSLVSVIVHHGSALAGHFTSYRKFSKWRVQQNQNDEEQNGSDNDFLSNSIIFQRKMRDNDKESWFHVSDDVVREANIEEVLSCPAYMCYYELLDEEKVKREMEKVEGRKKGNANGSEIGGKIFSIK